MELIARDTVADRSLLLVWYVGRGICLKLAGWAWLIGYVDLGRHEGRSRYAKLAGFARFDGLARELAELAGSAGLAGLTHLHDGRFG